MAGAFAAPLVLGTLLVHTLFFDRSSLPDIEPFLREEGFTPESFPEVLLVVLERATARLHERLSHGAVTF